MPGKHLLGDDHFTADATSVNAWFSLKIFPTNNEAVDQASPGDPGNPALDCTRQKRGNRTHASTVGSQPRLMRRGKGKQAKLSRCLNALLENRNEPLMDFRPATAPGPAELKNAFGVIDHSLPASRRIILWRLPVKPYRYGLLLLPTLSRKTAA